MTRPSTLFSLSFSSWSAAAASFTSQLVTVAPATFATAMENGPTPANIFSTRSLGPDSPAIRSLSVDRRGEK